MSLSGIYYITIAFKRLQIIFYLVLSLRRKSAHHLSRLASPFPTIVQSITFLCDVRCLNRVSPIAKESVIIDTIRNLINHRPQ